MPRPAQLFLAPARMSGLAGASLLIVHLQAITGKPPEDATAQLGSHADRREADPTSDRIVGIYGCAR